MFPDEPWENEYPEGTRRPSMKESIPVQLSLYLPLMRPSPRPMAHYSDHPDFFNRRRRLLALQKLKRAFWREDMDASSEWEFIVVEMDAPAWIAERLTDDQLATLRSALPPVGPSLARGTIMAEQRRRAQVRRYAQWCRAQLEQSGLIDRLAVYDRDAAHHLSRFVSSDITFANPIRINNSLPKEKGLRLLP